MRGPLVAASLGGAPVFQNVDPSDLTLANTKSMSTLHFPTSAGGVGRSLAATVTEAQPVHTQCRGHVSMLRLGTRLLMREMSLNSLAPASLSQPRVTTCSSRDATRPAFTAAICTCALFDPPTPHTHPAHVTSVEPRLAARYGTISLYRNVAIDYACKPKARPFMSTHSPPGTTTTSAV